MIKAHITVGRRPDGSLEAISVSEDAQKPIAEFRRLRDAGGGGFIELARGLVHIDIHSKHVVQEIKPARAIRAGVK